MTKRIEFNTATDLVLQYPAVAAGWATCPSRDNPHQAFQPSPERIKIDRVRLRWGLEILSWIAFSCICRVHGIGDGLGPENKRIRKELTANLDTDPDTGSLWPRGDYPLIPDAGLVSNQECIEPTFPMVLGCNALLEMPDQHVVLASELQETFSGSQYLVLR